MTLTKNKMIREIGRRTRLKNREVQEVVEALIEVWTEELVAGGRIELENFIVLEVKEINRGNNSGEFFRSGRQHEMPQIIRRILVKPSKHLKSALLK